MQRRMITADANEALASVAHRTNEVIVLYPITPSSPMGEWCDEWSVNGRTNIWGTIPDVTEMQSEAGDGLHRLTGPVADDPQSVQDRGGADLLLHARRRPHRRGPRPVDLRRP